MNESSVDAGNEAGDESHHAAQSVAPATPGAILSATRQGHGLTIEQVASHLNLAPRQVVALEADDFAALPGMVIARGFLRSYAKFLRLDPVALVAMLGEQNQPASSTPMRHALSGSFSESRLPSQMAPGGRNKSLPVTAGLAVVVAAAVASYALGWWPESLTRRVTQLRLGVLSITGDGAVDAAGGSATGGSAAGTAGVAEGTVSPDSASGTPGVSASPGGSAMLTTTTTLAGTALGTVSAASARSAPVATGGDPASGDRAASATPAGAAPMPALTPSPGLNLRQPPGATVAAQNPLVLNIQEDSWVELKRADNTPLVAKVIKAGTIETYDVTEPLTLTIGNIAGVEASLRGAPIKLASAASGNVARVHLK